MDEDLNIEDEHKPKRMPNYLMTVLVVLMFIVLFIGAFWYSIFYIVPAGHRGVKFLTFFGGTVTDKSWGEGIVFMFPWDQLHIYDTRVISGQDTIDALTQDGIQTRAEISYRYRPDVDSLGWIHQNLGLDYADKVMVPHVTAATRDVVSRYRIDALYTTGRSELQAEMLKKVRSHVDGAYPITILDLVVRNIVLDSTVEKSIADKLVKEQEMLAYDFILEKERKEQARKRIEALGIRQFRTTSGIDILKWRGIEATEKLSSSPNSKVIIIGTDSKELPIILGGKN
jgi:regulator of protease activity HflC (stomatin/prohibitin superfamily)